MITLSMMTLAASTVNVKHIVMVTCNVKLSITKLVFVEKFLLLLINHINHIITLSMITISGFHCIW
jgi:hypothetical protein